MQSKAHGLTTASCKFERIAAFRCPVFPKFMLPPVYLRSQEQAMCPAAAPCLQASDAALPMMYIDDCLDATWQLITASREQLQQTTYNVTAMSFTPAQLADAIR